MTKINFRHRARQHSKAAAAYIKSADEELQFAAALRMRMAIECLAYELLQSFEGEVSQDVMETWQPGRLIKELKKIDSEIEINRSISIGVEKVLGQASKEMRPLGTDIRLTAAWINKHWNALGSYLHEPTINQRKSGKISTSDSIRKRLATVQSEIEHVLSATLFATNFNVHITVTCGCGFEVKRREELLRKGEGTTCAGCGAMYGAECNDGEWRFFRLFQNYTCPNCESRNTFPANDIYDGAEFTCKECAAVVGIEKDWCVRLRSSPETLDQ